jgi:hypothetical protein
MMPNRQRRNLMPKKMSDTERAERALAICVGFDLGAPLFAALECDLAMLRTRDRLLYSAALVEAIAAEPIVDDWSELEAMHRAQRRRRR